MLFNSRKRHPTSFLALSLCVAVLPAVVAAETPVPDEIVVTARKRAESVQDVPLSIQALSADQLEQANIVDLGSLAEFAPGVSLFENVDRGYGQVFIRGMQNTPPVGDTTRELASVFIDGIYYTGGVSGINTDNIERVEVIKGPQSALLGRSTFSGAINFITRTPGQEPGGAVSAMVGSDDEYRLSGFVEGPLYKDVLAGRLSGRYRTYGGQYTNSLNGADLGDEEDQSVTGQLYLNPVPWLRAKLTGTYQQQDDGPSAATLTGKAPTHNFTSPSGTTFYKGEVPLVGPIAQNVFPSNDNLFGISPPATVVPFDDTPDSGRLNFRQNGLERDFSFISLDLNADLGDSGYVLSYLGGFSDEEVARLQDFELSAEENYFLSRRTDSDSSSHELRITSPSENRFRWLAGLYYLNQELYERDPGGIFGPGTFAGGPPFNIQPGQAIVFPGPRVIVDREIDNTAIFGSIAYDVTDRLTVSFEGRYQEDDLEDTLNRTTGETLSGDTSSFLPRLIVEYQLSDDVMLYGVAAQGLRPTTINSQYAARTDEEKAIIAAEYPELDLQLLAPEEEIWSYEIGAKTTALDNRLIVNLNAYYSDWTDRQDLRSLLADLNGDGAPESTLVTVSGTDVDVYGLELETSLAITDSWYASLVAAWNQSELKDGAGDATLVRFFLDQAPDGNRLPQVPEFSATLITEYRTGLGSSGLDWFVRGEGIYVGSRYASTLNLGETGDSTDVNLRFGLENERYSAVIFIENAFDDDTFESLRANADCATSQACSTQAYEAVLARQRSYGLSLQYRFQ